MMTLLNFTDLRRGQGLSLVQFAAKADLSISTVNQFELGRLPNATARTMGKLAEGYGVTISEIERGLSPATSTSPEGDMGTEGGLSSKVAGDAHPVSAGRSNATASQ